MSWAAIITIVIEILKQRAAAGWPLLKMLLEYFGGKVQADADADLTVMTVGAAPDEVKDLIVSWLETQKAKSGVMMRAVYAAMIRFVPLVADQIWDQLFAKGLVGKAASEFTQAVMTGTGESEADIFATI
jgi:hypothetical protein